MPRLLWISRGIDRLNTAVSQVVRWLVLVAVLISAGNAFMRYAFNTSSNAWLELQWYLFAAVFLLSAGYTLLCNEHVRIDVVFNRLSHRTRAWIDGLGTLVFLLPFAALIVWLSWPVFVRSFLHSEMSTDAGGLLRWPVKLLVPVGFLLLWLQGVSELIKRIAFLQGYLPDPYGHAGDPARDLKVVDGRQQCGEP